MVLASWIFKTFPLGFRARGMQGCAGNKIGPVGGHPAAYRYLLILIPHSIEGKKPTPNVTRRRNGSEENEGEPEPVMPK